MNGFANALITAGELCTAHIGELARWYRYNPYHHVSEFTCGVIRQIHHTTADTSIVYGEAAELEVTFDHQHPIMLGPDGALPDGFAELVVGATWVR